MTDSAWKLNAHRARLESNLISAEIDLARPGGGLFQIHLAARDLDGVRIMGLELPSVADKDPLPPSDAYAKAAELAATYGASRDWSVQVDAIWRELPQPSADDFLAAVELVVSVRTDSLEARPRMTVESTFPSGEVLPAALDNAERQPHSASSGCLIFRPAESDLSYVEMVHPLDFRGDEVERDEDGPCRVRHRLFGDALEKGVVLRARLRGFFVPRENDTRRAKARYAAFSNVEPPLGP